MGIGFISIGPMSPGRDRPSLTLEEEIRIRGTFLMDLQGIPSIEVESKGWLKASMYPSPFDYPNKPIAEPVGTLIDLNASYPIHAKRGPLVAQVQKGSGLRDVRNVLLEYGKFVSERATKLPPCIPLHGR
jgi:hypothetical protein